MTIEIPQYALRAYALLFYRHGTQRTFKQTEFDWIISQSMKKKIFSVLLRSGWIRKKNHNYVCTNPAEAITGLLEFRVPEIIKTATQPYAFTRLSAVEIWSDFSYVQRGREKSPYFIKILQKDLKYWKDFLHKAEIPNYIESGTTIGEYVILIPVKKLSSQEKAGYRVDSLKDTQKYAQSNEIYASALEYMKKND